MKPIWFVLFCAMAHGCDRARDEPVPPNASAGALAAQSDGGRDSGAAPATPAWTPFSRRDDAPLCLFARYADWGDAQRLADAKPKVALKAKRPLYFGTYVPDCADPECVRRVTLQCWAEVEGTSITVHTRFSGEQLVDHPCANNCQPASAACETPALEAGVYTLTHGAQQRTIRIPGVMEPACLTVNP